MSETWESVSGSDVTSAFVGITTPIRELYDEIHKRGWTVSKVDISDGAFLASAKNPHGEAVEATGNTDATAVGNLLVKIMRREWGRSPVQQRVGMWQSTFDDQLVEIAKQYAEAKVYDPKAAAAWKELGDDSMRRAEILTGQLHVEIVDDPNPYESLEDMAEDVKKKRHILVTRAMAHHPVWSIDQVVAFRLVHDVLGHVVAGGDWGWHGMNRAFAAHAPLLHETAQQALFTESLGQGAYNQVYRTLGPQKIAFLDTLENAQGEENQPGHSGIHPSQSIIPSELPSIPAEEKKESRRNGTLSDAYQSAGRRVEADESLSDPNDEWKPNVDPLIDNAFLWQKLDGPNGPMDPLDYQGLRDAAGQVTTDWHNLRHPDGTADTDSMRQAVQNAFRAVLSAPRKTARGHAQHYQALASMAPSISDPLRYFDQLEGHRSAHNMARGLDADFHKLHAKLIPPFKQYVKNINPRLSDREVDELARRELFNMQLEEEERATKDDARGDLTSDDIERQALNELQRRLKVITRPKANQKHDFGEDRLFFQALHEGEIAPYPAPLASHLLGMGAAAHNGDDLVMAARRDMARGGRGHDFRSTVLGLNLPGIGPKEASHAWMLLAPQTSQLGVISDPVLKALGHKPEEKNNRDYFKFERELHAGKDAAGYNHVPLGQFSWGLHDHMTYGPGIHYDLSAVRPLSPTPHTEIDWKLRPEAGEYAPGYWWDSTKEPREETGKVWDRFVATQHPDHEIPFVHTSGAFSTMIPFFAHPETGELHEGQPGQSLMHHMVESLGLSTPQIWQLDIEAGKRPS